MRKQLEAPVVATAEAGELDLFKMKQAASIFEEIAAIAIRADRLNFHHDPFSRVGADAGEHNEQFQTVLRDMFSKIGALADLGAEKIGGTAIRGGFEDWLLSPAYQALSDTVQRTADLKGA